MNKCNFSEKVDIPSLPEKKAMLKERPNHIYTNGKPQFLGSGKIKQESSTAIYEIKFLW